MIRYYNCVDGKYIETDSSSKNSFVLVTNPSDEEKNEFMNTYNILPEFLQDALDIDENPRIELEGEYLGIFVRCPIIQANFEQDSLSNTNESVNSFDQNKDFTVNITLLVGEQRCFLISSRENIDIDILFNNAIYAQHSEANRNIFLNSLLKNISLNYLHILKNINNTIKLKRFELDKSLDKDDLLHLLTIQTCLIYFKSALNNNSLIVEKLLNIAQSENGFLSFNEKEIDKLEDSLINFKQASSMSEIYTEVIETLLSTHSSIVGANVNMVMKILTVITLVLTIPSLIAGMYGMNVYVPGQDLKHAFYLLLSVIMIICIVPVYYLWKKGWFKNDL